MSLYVLEDLIKMVQKTLHDKLVIVAFWFVVSRL